MGRRVNGSPRGPEGKLQEMTHSNSSWWCRTAQEGKTSQFLRGRLGLAIRKSFFLQESGAALEGVPREAAKPNSLAQSHGALALGLSRSKPNVGLETPKQPIPPPVPPSRGRFGAEKRPAPLQLERRPPLMPLPPGMRPWFSSWSCCRTAVLRQPCAWRSWQDSSAFQGGCRLAKKSWYSLSDRGLPGAGGTGSATEDVSKVSSPGGEGGERSTLLNGSKRPVEVKEKLVGHGDELA